MTKVALSAMGMEVDEASAARVASNYFKAAYTKVVAGIMARFVMYDNQELFVICDPSMSCMPMGTSDSRKNMFIV